MSKDSVFDEALKKFSSALRRDLEEKTAEETDFFLAPLTTLKEDYKDAYNLFLNATIINMQMKNIHYPTFINTIEGILVFLQIKTKLLFV